MIKSQTKEVITEVQISKTCDVCGLESLTSHGWSGGNSEDLRLVSFVDPEDGDGSYQQMDFCPACFNRVVEFVYSLGGKFYEV